MKLENYEVHLPSYSIGDKIYDKIGPVCESYGKTVLVIGGRRALEAAYDKIKAAVDQMNLTIIGKELYGLSDGRKVTGTSGISGSRYGIRCWKRIHDTADLCSYYSWCGINCGKYGCGYGKAYL